MTDEEVQTEAEEGHVEDDEDDRTNLLLSFPVIRLLLLHVTSDLTDLLMEDDHLQTWSSTSEENGVIILITHPRLH